MWRLISCRFCVYNKKMTDALTTLIAQEKAKLLILEREVAARKTRIATLEGMVTAGDMDAFLDGKIATPKTAPTQQVVAETTALTVGSISAAAQLTNKPPRRKKGEVKDAILSTLTLEPQHINTLMARVKESGYDLNYDRIRTQMWHFKQVGLVESPKEGFFIQTTKGVEYLNSKKAL